MADETELVLFDAGGTLWDMRPGQYEIFHLGLKRQGIEAPLESVTEAIRKADMTFEKEMAALDGVNEEDFWLRYDRFVLEELGVTADVPKLSRDLSDIFDQHASRLVSWVEYPDVKPTLHSLKVDHYRMGLVSNATDLARRVMKNLGQDRYFEVAIFSEEVGVRKPKKEIFEIALAQVGGSPSRTVYVGDKYSIDVVGARNAGIRPILIDRNDLYRQVDCERIRNLFELRGHL